MKPDEFKPTPPANLQRRKQYASGCPERLAADSARLKISRSRLVVRSPGGLEWIKRASAREISSGRRETF
jgi:hypothetical protein